MSKIVMMKYLYLLCIAKTQLTEAQQEYDYVDWVPPERLYTIDILFYFISFD